jgi:hypothetical protein
MSVGGNRLAAEVQINIALADVSGVTIINATMFFRPCFEPLILVCS